MIRNLCFLACMLCTIFSANSQTTYYWAGASGTNTAPVDWAASWNTAPNGTGSARTVSSATDILVFDATQTLSANIYVGNVPKDSCGQLKFLNGINVTISTTNGNILDGANFVAYGTTYGGSVIPVIAPNVSVGYRVGDVVSSGANLSPSQIIGINGTDTMYMAAEGNVTTNANFFRVPTIYVKGNPGLTIDAASSLTIGSNANPGLSPFALIMADGAKGEVFGKVYWNTRGITGRFTSGGTQNLVFKSGSLAVANGGSSVGSSRGYQFGNPFGTGSTAAGTFAFINDGGRALFERGSTYQHNAQQATPFGAAYAATAPLGFVPAITFAPASNYLQTYGNGYLPYFFSSGATFGNIIWNSTGFPGTTTTTFFLNPARVDTLTITQMASPGNTNGGRVMIYGDYINNSVTTSNFGTMLFAGNGSVQKISGSNTTSPINNLFVLDQASVQLTKNILANALNIIGSFDAATFTVTGNGTSTFNAYNSFNRVYNSPAGSTNAIGGAAIFANSTTIHLRNVNTTNSNIIGSQVTSTSHPSAIPAGTIISAYISGGNFTMSKPATLSADSASTPTLSVTISNGAGTFATANANGIGGSLPSYATFLLGQNANYTFNATTSPFPSSVASPLSIGNLTLNGNVSLNKTVTTVNGTLTLNTSMLTVNATDTLKLNPANAVVGTFGPAAHINTVNDVATGTAAYVMVDNLATSRTLPVGSSGSYLPISINPESASSFAVSVKQGATNNGKPNGTPVADKTNIVDANYVINRLAGSSNATLTLAFPAALKGSGFNSIQNHQLGIQHYDTLANTWDAPTGGGNNSANFAQATFGVFSPFRVAVNLNGVVLPVKMGDISAYKLNNGVSIKWNVFGESNIAQYQIERSTDQRTFTTAGSILASGKPVYNFFDATPVYGRVLYRIKAIGKDNSNTYTRVALVDASGISSEAQVSPNPIIAGYFMLKLPATVTGIVTVKLYNQSGQVVMNKTINNAITNAAQVIYLPSGITKGNYVVVMTNGTVNKTISVVVD